MFTQDIKQAKLFRCIRPTLSALLCATLLGFSACTQEQKGKTITSSKNLYVKADISLKPTLRDVAQDFHYMTSITTHFQFTTASELLGGSPADSIDAYIFLNDHYVKEAFQSGIVDTSGIVTLAYTVPSMIVSKTNPVLVSNLSDLTEDQLRIGIADISTDLLGPFSIELLKKNLLYDKIDHLVQAGPTAVDLAELVAKGELDAAICWSMAYNWTPESFEVVLLMPNEIPRIAVTTAARAAQPVDSTNANRFMDYVKTDRCRFIFRKWGYLISDSDIDAYAPAAEIGGEPRM